MAKLLFKARDIFLILVLALVLCATFASPVSANTNENANKMNNYGHDYRSYHEYLEGLKQKQIGSLPTAKPLPSEATPEPIPEYLLSGGQIAGLVIGSIAVIVAIAAVFSYSLKNHERIETWGM
mmetsp:Transcript_10788/g.18467  ORF Transcript_10788/g.18467 Transcript_10788/m.18467 type:complete len:124 (+) Transcript_10788:199-570(+)